MEAEHKSIKRPRKHNWDSDDESSDMEKIAEIQNSRQQTKVHDREAATDPKKKALEELVELQEVIIKRQTKPVDGPKRPDKIELIKEFGDVQYRVLIYLAQEFPELTIDQISIKLAERMRY